MTDAAGYFRQGLELLGGAATSLATSLLVGLARSVGGPEGEGCAREAVRIAGEAGDTRIQAAAWHALGRVFREAARSDEAASAFCQALALRDPDDTSDISHDLFQLTELALENHHLEEAERWLGEFDSLTKKALPIPPSAASNFLRLRGCVARGRRNFGEALACFRSALNRQALDAPTNSSLRCDILTDLGMAYLQRGEIGMAAIVLTEAHSLMMRSRCARGSSCRRGRSRRSCRRPRQLTTIMSRRRRRPRHRFRSAGLRTNSVQRTGVVVPLNLTKGSNRMPGLVAFRNAARALSLPARPGGAPSRQRGRASPALAVKPRPATGTLAGMPNMH